MPIGLVTKMSTVPLPAGAVAVIEVVPLTVKLAAVAPNRTAVALRKAVPVIVTLVPPAAGPDETERLVTAGAEAGSTMTVTVA